MKTIFILDPYYADSHRHWAQSLSINLRHKIKIFSLSPIHWKWRMEGAAISLATRIVENGEVPDIFLVTDFLNLAVFKGLLPQEFAKVACILYMHENQLTYPISARDTDRIQRRDNHYGFINYTSALIADKVVYNSHYHMKSFVQGLRTLSAKLPDDLNIQDIIDKSSVIPLSIDLPAQYSSDHGMQNRLPTIVWNHRWEYDKRPDIFLEALIHLQESGLSFQLILLGKMDETIQGRYSENFELLRPCILHIGYCNSKDEYWNLLQLGDIVVSTSEHEFFGVSILEAMCAGCRPVLPYDLAYPELVPDMLHQEILYRRGDFQQALEKALSSEWNPEKQKIIVEYIRNKFSWSEMEKHYESLFESVMNEK